MWRKGGRWLWNHRRLSLAAALLCGYVTLRLGLSPIGKYQFRMLTTDFMFDTAKIKRELGWAPTLNNGQMLLKAFEHYRAHRSEILANSDLSANRSAITKLGLIRLVKMLS